MGPHQPSPQTCEYITVLFRIVWIPLTGHINYQCKWITASLTINTSGPPPTNNCSPPSITGVMVITEHKVHLLHLHFNLQHPDWLWCFLWIMKILKHLTPLSVTKNSLCYSSQCIHFHPINLNDLCTPEAEICWPTKTLDTSTSEPHTLSIL